MSTDTKGDEERRVNKEIVSIVAGDLLFQSDKRPGVVDLQTVAFSEALRIAARVQGSSDQALGRFMFMFDHPGVDWTQFLKPGITRTVKRAPHLAAIIDPYAITLVSAVLSNGLSSERVEAVPEEKLRQRIRIALRKRPELYPVFQEALVIADKEAVPDNVHDEDPFSDAKVDEAVFDDTSVSSRGVSTSTGGIAEFVVKCRGVAAGLFERASTYQIPGSTGRAPVDIVKAFFQRDSGDPGRVSLQVILDGAIVAQTHLGVESEVRVYFYTPVQSLGAGSTPAEQIHIVRDGRSSEVK